MPSATTPRAAKCEVLVLGDSHADVFKHVCMQANFPDHFFNVISVPGATVSGLENPNSATQALPIFEAGLKVSQAPTVIVMLGEVDVGFVIWFRSEKYGAPVQDLAQRTLLSYQVFLAELKQRFRVVWVSAPLPTIHDGNDWGDVANKRKEVKATQAQRTQLTLQFNGAMQRYCQGHSIDSVMLDPDSLGANGRVRQELLNDNPRDHHYSPTKHVAMIAEKLKPILECNYRDH